MGEFNYRKFLTENKLTYASREVAFSNLNEDLNKSDFEVGLIYLKEMGYDVSKESLNEIKFPSWITNFGKNIKSKVLDKFDKIKSNKDPLKKAKEEIQSSLDQLKLEYPEEWEEIKNMDLTDPKNISKIVPQENLQEAEKDDDISDKTLKKSKNKRRLGGLVALGLYIGMLSSSFGIGNNEIKQYAEDTDAKSKTELTQDVKTEPAIDPNTDYELGGDNNLKKFQHKFKTGESDIDDKKGEARELIKAFGIDKMSKGTEANIGVKGKISSTLGDQDDNPNGPKKAGLGKDRLNQGKEVLDIAKEISADEYGVTLNIEDQGTNVKDALADKSNELDTDSKEALSGQTTDYTLLDVEIPDKTPDPTPEDPTPESDDKPMAPQDIIAFYSKKPDFDSSKYLVIAFQLLPRIIGNGKVINNPEFERFAKHLTIAEKGETFNDKFVARRIDGEEGSLVKKAAKAKGTEKEEILDTIDTLRWIRNTKKSPSNIEKWIKRLDPDIKLGERGVFKHRWSKDIKNQGEPGLADVNKRAGRQAGPGKPGEEVGKNPTNMMESQSIYNEWISLLLEFNIAGYDEEAAKNNLGLLTQLYSGIWPRKDGSYIEYDNEYLEDKYKSSVDKFEKTFPTIKKKMAQYSKDQKDKKTDPKSTPTKTSPEQDKPQTEKPGEKVKATKVDTPKDTPKPGEKVKATKIEPKKGSSGKTTFFGTVDDPGKKQGTKKDDKEKSTSAVDFDAKDKSKTPQSAKALEKMGAKKDLTTALSRINNIGEAEDLMMALINYVRIDDDDKVKALKQAKARLTPLGDQPKYTSTSTSGAKVNYNLKEHITRLIGLILEAEKSQKPDVEKTVGILDKYADLKSHLDRLTSKEMTIEFILGIMQFLDPILQDKANTLKTALSNVARDLEKEPEKSSNKVKPEDVKGIANQLKAETLIRKKIRSLIKEQIRRITESDLEVIDVGNEKLKFELKEDSGHYYVIARGEEDNNVKGIIPGIKNGNDYMDKKIKENLCKDSETFKKWAKSQFSDVVEEDFTIREDYNTIIKTIDGMKEVKKDNFCKIDFTKK